MVSLQQHFSSMEETVRTLLQNQDPLEGPNIDPLDLMKAYKDKLLEEMWKQQVSLEGAPLSADRPIFPATTSPERDSFLGAGSGSEGENRGDGGDNTQPILDRLKSLEAENSALTMENDNQRKQYERCLDEVANQVVQALLTQKDLKEECVKLRTRVFDLEQQNRILSVLFQQRVKASCTPVNQEAHRNGKAGVPSARWPSLLSLTCPRSSFSGSEASLSSACSEYSSGSHTWAEGRGSSKQSALTREKRMSAGFVPTEQPDLAWKEGHVLKGLRRLQMRSPKEPSSPAPTSQYMASNEGIYCLGVKPSQKPPASKLATPTGKSFKPAVPVTNSPSDSDDADEESPHSPARQCDESAKEKLSLEGVVASGLGTAQGKANLMYSNSQEEPIKLMGCTSNLLSPVIDDLSSPESPTLKPGISPTESPTHTGKPEKNEPVKTERQSSIFKRWNDRDIAQTRAAERKSRLDLVKQPQERVAVDKEVQSGARDMSLPIQHAAARALNWANEARQRSASMDTPPYREQGAMETKDYTVLESPAKKPKPQVCDSARKAFILRSKSADGGTVDPPKQLHSPLHQKLIKVHHNIRPKGRGSNPPSHSIPSAKSNFTKVQGTTVAKGATQTVEKGDSTAVAKPAAILEATVLESLPSFPVKQSKVFKPNGLNEAPKSPAKASPPASKLPSRNESTTKGGVTNSVNHAQLKHRPQEQPSDLSRPELRSPSPPPPPGRTTSLLIRPGYSESLPQAHKQVTQPQTSVKAITNSSKPEANQSSPVKQMQGQVIVKAQDARLMAPKMGASPKRSKGCYPFPVHELKEIDCNPFSKNRLMANTIEESQSQTITVSQHGTGDQMSSEVPPQACGSPLCHGITEPQHPVPKAPKMSIPGGGVETTQGQVNHGNTFMVLRHDKSEINTVSKAVQTFETFNQEPRQTIHGINAAVAKAKDKLKTEARCNSLDSEPPSARAMQVESGATLDWGFDEEGWLFKRSVSVSTRPPLKPVMGMNGAKARSHSFGTRYIDRPNFNRSGKVRTQIKTHSGSSLNSLGDVFQGSMSCSNSYHCPMNRSLLNNFLMEEGLPIPSHLGASSDRFSLKNQREQARRLQIEEQLSSAFGDPVGGEPERQTTITTIEEKVMLGIEENLQKSQEQERTTETKVKSGSSLANWFGFRKTKLPGPSGKRDLGKVKEEKKEQRIGSLLGGKQIKTDKKKERRKSDGKESSIGRRESHDAVRQCLSMPIQGIPEDMPVPADSCGDTKMKRVNPRPQSESSATLDNSSQELLLGSGSTMRTLDSGIGTFPLPDPDSSSFSSSPSSILPLLPKSTPAPSPFLLLNPSLSSNPSPLPRWKVPSSGTEDQSQRGIVPMPTHVTSPVQSVPTNVTPPVQSVSCLAVLQSSPYQSVVTCPSVCDSAQSKLPRLASGAMEPKRLSHIKAKTRPAQNQQADRARPQLAN